MNAHHMVVQQRALLPVCARRGQRQPAAPGTVKGYLRCQAEHAACAARPRVQTVPIAAVFGLATAVFGNRALCALLHERQKQA